MEPPAKKRAQNVVLVGVLKNRADLRILLRERWYRVPALFTPKRQFTHVAFYQPATFERGGKRIRYYARVAKREKMRRIDLLPKETGHPRALEEYVKLSFQTIDELTRPIKNVIPRRISFGFTTLRKLRSAKDILELYGVPKTEQLVARRLRQLGIKTASEYTVAKGGGRYRIDIAVFCKKGAVAVECDNKKAHSGKVQLAKDAAKDAFLETHGWRVIRLTEKDIVEHLDRCAQKVQKAVRGLGGKPSRQPQHQTQSYL